MQEPTEIMMWRISEKMNEIISSEYLLGGSVGASLWSVGDSEFDRQCSQLASGSMVLLFREENKHFTIVGGGYFLGWHNFGVRESWELYGVRNGAYSYEDFVQDIKNRGGDESSTLSSATVMHTFVFNDNDHLTVPDELSECFIDKQHFTFKLDEPVGRYLRSRVLEVRDNYISNDGNDWQGLYYMASHRNSKSYMAEFHARVMHGYGYRCALTGVTLRPVLMIAHIQPFYDAQFQNVSNGIVLRSDIYTLFKSGYITFVYNEAGDRLITKVSPTIDTTGGGDYRQFDGKELLLPEDRSLWPERKYITWHNKNCFESWLRVGGTHV